MRRILLLSNSTLHGSEYLEWPRPYLKELLGTLIKGLGSDHVVWGTDSVFYGSPQWQIEALRRLEIPEDLQERHRFSPLGPATGPTKQGILGLNSARLYGLEARAPESIAPDDLDRMKSEYEWEGIGRSNLAYGYVDRGARTA